uniref:Uncharacterized protein n=1 Tax=Anguilla anguilla TaxID=7936 RepID=A0A0E9VI19_ANGAN
MCLHTTAKDENLLATMITWPHTFKPNPLCFAIFLATLVLVLLSPQAKGISLPGV